MWLPGYKEILTLSQVSTQSGPCAFHKAMESKWGPFGLWFRICVALISLSEIRRCWSLNDEGSALLEFRLRITSDPYGALANWNPNDSDACNWSGVHCVDGKVQMLDLNGLRLEGTLSPELGKLSHLKSLVLWKNKFSGTIPEELGDLDKLELLDLRENSLSGSIPAAIGSMLLLKRLLVCSNKVEVSDSQELRSPSKPLFVDNWSSTLATLFSCKNRKFGHYVWHRDFKQWNKEDPLVNPIKGAVIKSLNALALPLFKLGKASPGGYENLSSIDVPEIGPSISNLVSSARRKLIGESSNVAAAPYVGGPPVQISFVPITVSSGAFPAVPVANNKQNQPPTPLSPPSDSQHNQSPTSLSSPSDSQQLSLPSESQHHHKNSPNTWKYILIILGVVVLVLLLCILLFIWRKRAAKAIKPWKTGISGQLQKAFVTGVPKLNRAELETACEDFSNIISTFDECTIYKGTLSSGVEIAVVSTSVTSSKDWSKNMEMAYRKKIDTLSRINHKNFTNLIGYCDEEEPFTRMMVLEYAPSGSLFEHLHVAEVEHLDWSARMRIVMGTAYCLQYMHHDLNPPVSHSNLNSVSILLTDDFAAKISEITFGKNVLDSKKSELPPQSDPETDVYNFGTLLLEIISGKLPYSEEQGPLVKWASDYLSDKRKISYLIDPTLQSFKDNELSVICEVIQECIQSDPRLRPPVKDITCKLREVLNITPDQAVPRLSPLWWAELEILSVEAT